MHDDLTMKNIFGMPLERGGSKICLLGCIFFCFLISLSIPYLICLLLKDGKVSWSCAFYSLGIPYDCFVNNVFSYNKLQHIFIKLLSDCNFFATCSSGLQSVFCIFRAVLYCCILENCSFQWRFVFFFLCFMKKFGY